MITNRFLLLSAILLAHEAIVHATSLRRLGPPSCTELDGRCRKACSECTSFPEYLAQCCGTAGCSTNEECDDGNGCTLDLCISGSCDNSGNACTSGQTCSNNQCIATFTCPTGSTCTCEGTSTSCSTHTECDTTAPGPTLCSSSLGSCVTDSDCRGGGGKCKVSTVVVEGTCVEQQQQTCPAQHCASDVPNTAATVDSATLCPNLEPITIARWPETGDDIYIELTGPANMADAADLVITSPHGGDLKPEDPVTNTLVFPDRTENHASCPSSGCVTSKDSYSLEISELLQTKFRDNYCKIPFVVKNHLHRSKLDANREVWEAAQGNQNATDAWQNFHDFIHQAQISLQTHFGTDTSNGITGVKSLLFDMHGYAGLDWVPTDGSPFIQWGYRLSDDTSLNPDLYCPLDTRSSGTIGSLTHARWMPGQSYECLVRGPGSLASRVSTLIGINGGLGTSNQNSMCGFGTPSFEYESPWHLANDPVHCLNGGGGPCHYYSGGYDVEVHERMDWWNVCEGCNAVGNHFNSLQAELPRCIRFGGDAVRAEFANVLSVAVMSFLRDVYGAMP